MIQPITQADVVAFASELGDTGSNAQTPQFWVSTLAYVNQINLTNCDSDADRYMARVYLAAHIGTITGYAQDGTAGPVTEEAAGGVRTSYGLVAMTSTPYYLARTGYGQMYLDLINMSLCGLPTVI